MKYRAEIDGLRALAVIPVIFFHAGFEAFSGGFVGVDVFFVISGYLITTIIVTELNGGKFTLLNFYERRARRILPALFLVVLFCLPFAWAWLMPRDLKDFAQSVLGVSIFSSNIVFFLKSGYFDTAAELKPLLHTWSLAIEEQFYVFFPLILIVIMKWGRSLAVITISILLVSSLMASIWASYNAPSAAFYLLPFRAWELMLGAIAAFILLGGPIKVSSSFANALSAIGLVLIAASVALFEESIPFPGIAAMLPTFGTALVILFAYKGTIAAKILSTPIFVQIGLISYGAYLWHQPLFAFARHRSLVQPSPIAYLALAALALVLAYLTWKFVEGPIRNRKNFTRTTVLWAAGALSAGIAMAGYYGHKQNGFPLRFSENLREIAASGSTPLPDTDCIFNNNLPSSSAPEFANCYAKERTVYILGDSHAQRIAPALSAALISADYAVIGLLKEGCMPVTGISRGPRHQSCPRFNEEAAQLIADFPGIVVLSARWRLNIEGTAYNNREGGIEYDEYGRNFVINDPSADVPAFIQNQLTAFSNHHPLVIVDQIPEAGWNVPEQMLRIQRFARRDTGPLSTSYNVYATENARVLAMFAGLNNSPYISIINTSNLVCDVESGRCLNERDGVPLYVDDDHPSNVFSTMIAQEVLRAVIEADALPRPVSQEEFENE